MKEKDLAQNEKDSAQRDFEISRKELCFLNSIPGIGSKIMFQLYEALKEEGCSTIWTKQGKEIITEQLKEANRMDFSSFYEKGKSCFEERYEEWGKQGFHYIPFTCMEYPKRLQGLDDPPFALWVKGQMVEDDAPAVAIVGARQCSEYGRKIAYLFGRELADSGIQIISGMARGIDGLAQKGALDADGRTYAVLGCGVDCCYPKENRSLYEQIPIKGGILSEYALGTEAESRLFPARNRIISGLSDLLLVVEARRRSGTYITVTQALEQGREIFAVPGRVTDELSSGCHNLIKDGAGIAVCPEDILAALKMHGGKKTEKKEREEEWGMNEDEKYLLSLMDLTPVDPETLSQRTAEKYSYQELNWHLLNLKMKGKVDSIGNYYFRS